MSFVYYCPFCDQKIECEDEDNGAEAPCPACKRNIKVRKSADYGSFDLRNKAPAIVIQTADSGTNKEPAVNNAPGYVASAHKKSILAVIFIICAVLHFTFAIILIFAAVGAAKNGTGSVVIASIVAGAGISLFFGLIFLGIAEFFSYVSRISENSEAIRKLLEMMVRTQK